MARDSRLHMDFALTVEVRPCANGETREWRLVAAPCADRGVRIGPLQPRRTLTLATVFESEMTDEAAMKALLAKTAPDRSMA